MSAHAVEAAVRRVGEQIKIARKKRRIALKDFADRLGVTVGTVTRLERGDAGVRVETLATALLVLGLLDRFEGLAAASDDDIGLGLDKERLPQRIRRTKAGRPQTPRGADTGHEADEGMVF